MNPPASPTTSSVPEPGAIDSRRLQVFLAAAQTSSFAAAAEKLSLTPSAVSHAIKALEEEFDCNLFKRHGPRVTLTRAGIRLMPLAEELLTRMARLRKEVAIIQSNPRSLRVMMPEMFCALMLPRVLPDFMECFPLALFEIVPAVADEEQAAEALMSGEVDLLISHGTATGRELVRRDLYRENLGLYAAPFHTLARRPRIELDVFEQHPLLVADESLMKAARERLFSGDASRARLWRVPSVESARELARVGQAVALLPECAAAGLVAQGQLLPLELAGPRLPWVCTALWSGQTGLGWATEVFLSLIAMVAQENEEAGS